MKAESKGMEKPRDSDPSERQKILIDIFAVRNSGSGLANHDLCLERLNVAEVFPNDTPDLLCSLFRILVEENLHDVALLRLER